MANLDVTRLYSDGEVLEINHLDQIVTDIETFLNTTKIGDDNIQNKGITASTKFVNESISSAKFSDLAITSSKIEDSAVTAAKIQNNAVTNSKVVDQAVTAAKTTSLFLYSEIGKVRLFHTYGSISSEANLIDIPRGWMICNGDRVTEANYDAIHGSGSWAEDGVSSSALALVDSGNGAYLPSMSNLYAVGDADNDTSQTGISAITTVGNAGSEVDISHTHTLPPHSHDGSDITNLVVNSAGSTDDVINTASGTSAIGTSSSTNTSSSLSSDGGVQDIRPSGVNFLFLMRVI